MGAGFVRDAALVDGPAAHVIDRVLAAYLPNVLAGLPPWMRAEVEAAKTAIRAAALAYEALPVAAAGRPEVITPEADQGWMCVGGAADVLGVSRRRVRQLAASGELGARKVGPVWQLDRSVVLAERRRREANSGE